MNTPPLERKNGLRIKGKALILPGQYAPLKRLAHQLYPVQARGFRIEGHQGNGTPFFCSTENHQVCEVGDSAAGTIELLTTQEKVRILSV